MDDIQENTYSTPDLSVNGVQLHSHVPTHTSIYLGNAIVAHEKLYMMS